MIQYSDLPIVKHREDILKAVQNHQVIVVHGGTGSGKSTQLPKILLESGLSRLGKIGCTQPRRIAALGITDRLREELGQEQPVGCKIRFHEDIPENSLVKIMTDGILLQEFRSDRLLPEYSAIILDEAHERSLNIDILLGILKNVIKKRPEFRLIVTSATLDTQKFSRYFANAPILSVGQKIFPVDIAYFPEEENTPGLAEHCVDAITQLQARGEDNLLCFLPTEKEIHEIRRLLEEECGNKYSILSLYGRLPASEQKKIFQPQSRPKIILATNIAETSITIDGIGYVVDSGLARISRYHPQTRILGLPIEKISRASANQRSGRAGRTKPGVCVRLYSEDDYNQRPEFTQPEILRTNLANVVLQLKMLGVGKVEEFPFIDPPPNTVLRSAHRALYELGAIDSPELDARVTKDGREISRLPCDVTLARILITGRELGVTAPLLIIASGLAIQDPRYLPSEGPEREKANQLFSQYKKSDSDFITLLQLWMRIREKWQKPRSQRKLRKLCQEESLVYQRVREWMDLREQLSRMLTRGKGKPFSRNEKFNPDTIDQDSIHRSLLAGFLSHVAQKKPQSQAYRLASDKEAWIFPGSGLFKSKPKWLISAEIRQTSRLFLVNNCSVQPDWIEQAAGAFVKYRYYDVEYNPVRGFVEAKRESVFRGFILSRGKRVDYGGINPEACSQIFWLQAVVRGPLQKEEFHRQNLKKLAFFKRLEKCLREHGLVPTDEELAEWYYNHAPEIHSRHLLEKHLETGYPDLVLNPAEVLPKEDQKRLLLWSGAFFGHPSSIDQWEKAFQNLFPAHTQSGRGIRYHFDTSSHTDGAVIRVEDEIQKNRITFAGMFRLAPAWLWYIWKEFIACQKQTALDQINEKESGILFLWLQLLEKNENEPVATLLWKSVIKILPELSPAFPGRWPIYTNLHLSDGKNIAELTPVSGPSMWFESLRKGFGGWVGEMPPPVLQWKTFAWGGSSDLIAVNSKDRGRLFVSVGEANLHHNLLVRKAESRRAVSSPEEQKFFDEFKHQVSLHLDRFLREIRCEPESVSKSWRLQLCMELWQMFKNLTGQQDLKDWEKWLKEILPVQRKAKPRGAKLQSLEGLKQLQNEVPGVLNRYGPDIIQGTVILGADCFIEVYAIMHKDLETQNRGEWQYRLSSDMPPELARSQKPIWLYQLLSGVLAWGEKGWERWRQTTGMALPGNVSGSQRALSIYQTIQSNEKQARTFIEKTQREIRRISGQHPNSSQVTRAHNIITQFAAQSISSKLEACIQADTWMEINGRNFERREKANKTESAPTGDLEQKMLDKLKGSFGRLD